MPRCLLDLNRSMNRASHVRWFMAEWTIIYTIGPRVSMYAKHIISTKQIKRKKLTLCVRMLVQIYRNYSILMFSLFSLKSLKRRQLFWLNKFLSVFDANADAVLLWLSSLLSLSPIRIANPLFSVAQNQRHDKRREKEKELKDERRFTSVVCVECGGCKDAVKV